MQKLRGNSYRLGLGVTLSVLFALKVTAYFAPFPGIIPDEWLYLNQVLTGDISYGNYLHSALYGVTERCGEAWYSCAKGINVAFELMFALAIASATYVQCRKIDISVALGAVAFLGPFVYFGGYYLPESMFVALVGMSFASAWAVWGRKTVLSVVPGVFLGLAALTKPHALAVFAVILLLVVLGVLFKIASRDTIVRALLLLLSFVTVRFGLGFAFFGIESLVPTADYAGDILRGESSLLQFEGRDVWSALGAASAAAVANALPAIALLAFLLLIFVRKGQSWRIVGTNVGLYIGLVFFLSFVALTVLFAVYLELRGIEDVTARTMTRYWEFSIIFLFAPLISEAKSERGEDSDQQSQEYKHNWLWAALLIVSGGLLLSLPRSQTLADSTLAQQDYILVFIAFIFAAGISVWARVRQAESRLVPVFVWAAILGASATVLNFQYSIAPKTGFEAGAYLGSVFQVYDNDRERVAFVGQRDANVVGAFVSRAVNPQLIYLPFYESINYVDLRDSPRWVVAGKENYVAGESVSEQIFGDQIVYEFGYPFRLQPVQFQKYKVDYEGEFRHAYWGSWSVNESFKFTVPRDITGNVLTIELVLNEELDNRNVEITAQGMANLGELQPNQIVTPVTLKKDKGESWAGEEIEVRYLGEKADVEESRKGLALALAGFSVLNE